MNTTMTHEFVCSVCGKRTGLESRGRYNAMDKLIAQTDWRILPRNSYAVRVYCPDHAKEAA